MPPKTAKKPKFEPGDLVLAKMAGWSAWPSFVMPREMIPPSVLKAKKKTTDYCVIFIPDGDYYWMTEKNLEGLSTEKLLKKLEKIPKKAKPKKGRTLNVNDALLAAENLTFDAFMSTLEAAGEEPNISNDSNAENVEDEDDVDDDEEEAIIDDDDGDIIEEKGSKKDDEVDGDEGSSSEESSVTKNIKGSSTTAKQAPLNTEKMNEDELNPKDENEDGIISRRKRSLAINGPRKAVKVDPSNGKKVTPAPKASSPRVQTKEERQHQLWLCRIKLQRTLIQRNQPVTPSDPKKFPPPTADELLVARLILHRLVDFPVDIELLKKTKIHKVLRCILRDENLAYRDSFQLHEKCEELLNKWEHLIEAIRLDRKAHTNGSLKPGVSHENSRTSSQAPDDSEVSAVESNSNSVTKGES